MKEEDKQEDKGALITVFFPEARCLSEEEIKNLPNEKKRIAVAKADKGVWLEVFCPDRTCLVDGGKIMVPVLGADKKETKGFWLNLFCPEDRCIVNEPTDLP